MSKQTDQRHELSDQDGYERKPSVVYDASLVEWLLAHGASEGVSSFGLEKGMGERIDVYIERPATVSFVFYVPVREAECHRQKLELSDADKDRLCNEPHEFIAYFTPDWCACGRARDAAIHKGQPSSKPSAGTNLDKRGWRR